MILLEVLVNLMENTGGEGDDNKAGDKGQLDGDPYAPSYFGDPGTGSGGVVMD